MNSPDILALCETNLDESIDCGNFSVRGYLPLIRKGYGTCMHGLAVYMKEGLPFAWDLSVGNSADSYLSFPLVLFHSVSYFFFLSRSPLSLCMVFYSIPSSKEEVLSINPSANVFVFGVFNVIIRTSLPLLVELIDLVNSTIIFLSQTTLLRWLTFLHRSLTVDSQSPALLDLFLSSDASICSTMPFPLLGNSDHIVSVSTDFPSYSQCDVLFHHIVYDYFHTDWDGRHDHLRDVSWEEILKLSASSVASEFCEWVQVGIDVYIPHQKYQAKPHISMYFS